MSTPDLTTRLVDFLSRILAFADSSNRSMLLNGLPGGPVSTLARHAAPRADLHGIVQAALSMGRLPGHDRLAIEIVLDNTVPFIRGTQHASELDDLRRIIITDTALAYAEHSQPAGGFASGPPHRTGTAREPVLGLDRGALVAFLSRLAPPSWATYLASIPGARGACQSQPDHPGAGGSAHPVGGELRRSAPGRALAHGSEAVPKFPLSPPGKAATATAGSWKLSLVILVFGVSTFLVLSILLYKIMTFRRPGEVAQSHEHSPTRWVSMAHSPTRQVSVDVSVFNAEQSSLNIDHKLILLYYLDRNESQIRINSDLGYQTSFRRWRSHHSLNYSTSTHCPFLWDFPSLISSF